MGSTLSALSILGALVFMVWLVYREAQSGSQHSVRPVSAAALPSPFGRSSAPESRQPDRARTAVDLASRGARLGAAILDNLSSFLALMPGLLLFGLAEEMPSTYDQDLEMGALLLFFGALFTLLIVQLVLLAKRGQTIGKWLLDISIVDVTDQTLPSWGRLVGLRYLLPGVLGAVPVFGVLFAAANVLFIFRDDRRCIHDHLAGTLVIDGGPYNTPPSEAAAPLESTRAPQPPPLPSDSPNADPDPSPTSSEMEPSVADDDPDPADLDDALDPALLDMAPPDEPMDMASFTDRLDALRSLHEADALTDNEYATRRMDLLDRLLDDPPFRLESLLLKLMPLRRRGLLSEDDVERAKERLFE